MDDGTPDVRLPGQSLVLLRGMLRAVRQHVDLPTFQAITRDVPAAVLEELAATRQWESEQLLRLLVVEMRQVEER